MLPCRLSLGADLAAQAAKARRQEEVAAVLAALERAHGIGRARVTSIRRIQNIRLWTKFQLRRHEVLEQAGGVCFRRRHRVVLMLNPEPTIFCSEWLGGQSGCVPEIGLYTRGVVKELLLILLKNETQGCTGL